MINNIVDNFLNSLHNIYHNTSFFFTLGQKRGKLGKKMMISNFTFLLELFYLIVSAIKLIFFTYFSKYTFLLI